MNGIVYIQAILPLRLEWDPCYSLPEGMQVTVGTRVRVPFARQEYVGVVCAVDVTPETDTERILPIRAVETGLPPVLPQEIAFWRKVSDYYLCSVGEVYKAAYPALKVGQEEVEARIRERNEARLEQLRGKLEKARKDETRERYRKAIASLESSLSGEALLPDAAEISLSPAQEKALGEIHTAFQRGKTVLLNGVTGSGKTEIYLKLSAETLSKGKSVLYLVPEIALSRQLEDRIAEIIPSVQVYHSGESAYHRRQVATRVRDSRPSLVLGTRSALFLPHHNLGLIIVDEEHDTSYKQEAPAPRYHGRETAIMLGVLQGAPVVLGSATPSLESLYNAEIGRFIKVDLKERFHQGEEARILLVDTVAERRKRGMVGHLSRKLLAAIRANLDAGGQTLVLRARRSYSPSVQCTECGKIPKCPHCNVPLSLHRQPDRLVCHYCGHSEPYTGHCPSCGSELQSLGAGTQRIEEELQEQFPQASIARLDSDTPDTEEAGIIRRFAEGKTDILVGTQVITKGFDFDRLNLVAVIQADSLVGQQDFRADERALQLLEQFRGRSGRRGKAGEIIIQTREPEHPVYARLSRSENGSPLLDERKLFGYPPYTRLVHILLKDSNEKRLDYLSEKLRECLSDTFSEAACPPVIVGPYAPAVNRIAGESIRQIRVTFRRDKALTPLKHRLAEAVSLFGKQRKYLTHITLDVDPA